MKTGRFFSDELWRDLRNGAILVLLFGLAVLIGHLIMLSRAAREAMVTAKGAVRGYGDASVELALTLEATRRVLLEIQDSTKNVSVQLEELARQAKFTAFEVKSGVKALREEVEDPNQKRARLRMAQAMDELVATEMQIREETIPAINRTLDSVNRLVQHTDKNVNNEILPRVALLLDNVDRTAKAFRVDTHELLVAFLELSKDLNISIDNVNVLLASGKWQEILDAAADTSKNTAQMSRHLEEGLRHAPATFAQVEQILRTASRFQKVALITGLAATLIRAVIP